LDTNSFLKIDNIFSTYGKFDVLKGVSFEVDKGECICIIGPNGAGKSTVFKSITGFLHPRRGSIYFKKDDITYLNVVEIMKKGIVYVFQHHSIFQRMKVIENLEMGAFTRKDKVQIKKDINTALEMFPVLAEKKNELAGTMSGGQQRMLEIARALIQRPELLLLDEPTLGLAPTIVRAIFQKIRETNEQLQITLMIVEQNAKSALSISHRAYVLENGKNRMDGPTQEIQNNPEVIKLYLGGE
jgi:branched-chain amino acid transport system ATP-binding protein